ncbi:MAG: NCS2 family permease [Phycisphaerales bacterium]|nr:NCS2 family permease [Phycisphaerales bacterium]MCB9863127.1 NCS2 family permease [Phycisphaerales bacterium]
MQSPLPAFVKRDLDGFFGLFIDNLVQLLLIISLCSSLCGMSGEASELIYGRILPGAAVSLIVGNLFYAWQARRLAAKENRTDVCALPYGINTPSMLVYIFFVIKPAYDEAQDAEFAWKLGLIACLGSGAIEFLGAFVAERLRKHTPRAALLSTLAGIAIGFISMTFALQIWQWPIVAMAPLAIILVVYFSGIRLPLGLPGGLIAVSIGTLIAWMLPSEWTNKAMTGSAVATAWSQHGLQLPGVFLSDIVATLTEHKQRVLGLLGVIVPMGLFNLIGSLQNIESAEAAGDRYATAPSLAVNGIGTIVAACCGSCFPTTIYIGHPGWKGLGARAGYSTLNGVVITLLVFTGTLSLVASVVPVEAGIAIVFWIGIVITAQAFQATPTRHAPAVAIGLFPAIAAWGATVVMGAYIASGGSTIEATLASNSGAQVNGFWLHGLLTMERGYILTCMIVAAVSANLIDRKFSHAAIWSAAAAILTSLGLMHAYSIRGNGLDYYFPLFSGSNEIGGRNSDARMIAMAYLLMAIVFQLLGWHAGRTGQTDAASAEATHG